MQFFKVFPERAQPAFLTTKYISSSCYERYCGFILKHPIEPKLKVNKILVTNKILTRGAE